jgi:hypothetical protein
VGAEGLFSLRPCLQHGFRDPPFLREARQTPFPVPVTLDTTHPWRTPVAAMPGTVAGLSSIPALWIIDPVLKVYAKDSAGPCRV